MSFWDKFFVEVKRGTKVTYSESDLNKLDRMYETEVIDRKDKKIMSPFRKEAQRSLQSQIRDYAFERILDRHLYTFSHMLVIPNPYGLAKQTALILFNSSKEAKIVYRVIGDKPENDFTGETELTKRHRVPILGLYQNRNNKVDISMFDAEGNLLKHRVLTIYVSAIQKNITEIISGIDKKESHFPFVVLNGISFNPFALDGNGDIRYALQYKTGRLGMIPLQNGRFLMMDKTANIMNEFGKMQPCRYQEMDYMGRVYRTFLFEYQIGRAIAQNGDSLFLVTSSDSEHITDKIIELDMNTGDIIRSCSMADILGDKYRTCKDWANISNIVYNDGYMLITARKLHSVIKLNWNNMTLEWIFAPSVIWKDTDLEKYTLKTDGEEIVCSCPEYTLGVGENNSNELIVFEDNRKVGVALNKKSYKKSYARIIKIDEEKLKYSSLNNIEIQKAICYGKIVLSDDGKYILACQGSLKEKTDECRAALTEIDAVTGQKFRKVDVAKAYTNAWIFEPDIKGYCHSMELNSRAVFGSIKPPAVFDGELPPVSSEKIEKSYFGACKLCDELFLCSMMAGCVDRIYFVGEQNAYVQDYSGMELGSKKEFFAVSLSEMKKDEYNVYVEYEGECHKLKNEIRVVK